jgi:effector-binding domain-containing protein
MIARIALASLMFVVPGLAFGQQPKGPPAGPPPVVTRDAIGEEITLPARPVLFRRGTAEWEEAWDKVRDAFRAVRAEAERLKLKVTGAPLLIYRATDDDGFDFEAALPIEAPPAGSPGAEFTVGPAPEGPALKFVHRGAFASLENTYEMIGSFIEAKGLETEELAVEEYISDPLTAKPDAVEVNVYVPLKRR